MRSTNLDKTLMLTDWQNIPFQKINDSVWLCWTLIRCYLWSTEIGKL